MTGIMVVDDQPTNRLIIARLADAVDHDQEVLTFGNPLDALAHAADEAPDLLITDYKMEPIDGDEFIRRFREVPDCKRVPILVVTAHDLDDIRGRVAATGSTYFLRHPINHEEFKLYSRRALEESRERRFSATCSGGPEDTAEYIEKAAADAGIDMVSDMMRRVNAELVIALDALENTRLELRQVLDISGEAVVLIDADLRVRGHTPLAGEIYDLDDASIGQSLDRVATILDYPDLRCDLKRLVGTGAPFERRLKTRHTDARYAMRATPRRAKDGRIAGAALTFTKIDV